LCGRDIIIGPRPEIGQEAAKGAAGEITQEGTASKPFNDF